MCSASHNYDTYSTLLFYRYAMFYTNCIQYTASSRIIIQMMSFVDYQTSRLALSFRSWFLRRDWKSEDGLEMDRVKKTLV